MSAPGEGRMAPFYCPYCGEENLLPEPEGAWRCEDCLRVFAVRFVGLHTGREHQEPGTS
ncbi:hypothetical protein [Allosaccharopolyspora coralli]|uniref:hypothetical protein n=1 Tax=Allosaccharopolyspora coralli TaxID=2665642 RepID=UPI0016528A12|nr:hypothetical protein [Allosaccharopolyspora coralli]